MTFPTSLLMMFPGGNVEYRTDSAVGRAHLRTDAHHAGAAASHQDDPAVLRVRTREPSTHMALLITVSRRQQPWIHRTNARLRGYCIAIAVTYAAGKVTLFQSVTT
jgi:hypothetical protein